MQFKLSTVALLALALAMTVSVVRAQDDFTSDDSNAPASEADYEPTADSDESGFVDRRAWYGPADYPNYEGGYLVRRDLGSGYGGLSGLGGIGGISSGGYGGGYGGAGGHGGSVCSSCGQKSDGGHDSLLNNFGYIPSIRATNTRTNAKVLKDQKLAFAKLNKKKIKANSKLAVKA
ncbi:hypothetical protein H4R33_001579 [Dimargaris cristalligena]|uniref:Uncharacterized protein n=1 Tax=Dimargaris cristalligena TaxID=215637 RepID=A0A4Q0A3E3_9FUNG|nr:hypothetical protein H4R33_001579 [Dimargaris cristalligena]RKP40111.1 hypothetical protein BJ085DRAFT_36391 [Dimargaris cristalligena]|eukprot:RKP40111.1 hypothetical protein BJ085DRAFT_36391 [Dimargaris cristalligena]